ncbi:conserved transmembrane protein [Mycobacterium intracellulare]|nr:conserved transmembrane protein [Mycobacterium intracellulare]
MRLAVFAAFLAVAFYLVAVAHVIDIEEIRRVVSATGPAAPLTYVVVSAVAGALFVPGSILAAGSGLLFGPLLGVFVTLGATVGTAIVASFVGRRAGRDSARALLGAQRADRFDALIGRRGCGRWSGSASFPASRTRWPRTRSGRSEFRCGRWPLARSSVRFRGPSSTPHWAPRSATGRRRWPTRRSRCGA